jgi:hypothetical protein
MRWDTVAAEFEFDGSWRDICVLETSIVNWQASLDAIRASTLEFTYRVAGVATDLPTSARAAFPEPGFSDRLLEVRTSGVILNCHFFEENEVEFDLDPREVKSQRELDAVLLFMSLLAEACRKPVSLTPENGHWAALIRVRPGASPEHILWQDGRPV